MSALARLLVFGMLLILAALLLPACGDDDPLTSKTEHFEAIGMYFTTSGIPVASILRGVTTDTFHVPLGALTSHIDAEFYDDDENIIGPPASSDHSLGWAIDDSAIVEVWQHEGEEGSFEFHLRGLAVGETHIEFFVVHLNHNDYRSGKIPVAVAPDPTAHDAPIGVIVAEEDSGDSLATSFLVDSSQAVQGGISLASGTTTDHLEVEFFDHNNIRFTPPVPPHALQVISGNSSVVVVTGQSPDEPWAFKLQGVSPGATTITINILHDGAVGKAFKPIPVTVN
jgi:hypothetical protein